MSSAGGGGQGNRVARAATRYRPGKAPVNAEDDFSSDDSDGNQDERQRGKASKKAQQYDQPITNVTSGTAALKDTQRRTAGIIIQNGGSGSTKPIVKLENVVIGGKKGYEEDADEDDSDEYETDTDDEGAEPSMPSKPVFKKPKQATDIPKEESSEYETDSEEEEESEE
jgi:microfibrillar-associated protein 1